jgi:hypothetical protein
MPLSKLFRIRSVPRLDLLACIVSTVLRSRGMSCLLPGRRTGVLCVTIVVLSVQTTSVVSKSVYGSELRNLQ